MLEQLGVGKVSDYYHLVYGYIRLKGKGKMSSRKGNVVSADWLLDEMVSRAEKINKKVGEEVGIGAIKYGLLKLSREKDVEFDIDESLSLEGNSGPYIQYTYARIRSLLEKGKKPKKDGPRRVKRGGVKQKMVIRAKEPVKKASIPEPEFNKEEEAVLRAIIHFPEVVRLAAERHSPNLVCGYLYDLASSFNALYNKHRILDLKTGKHSAFRLMIAGATGQILENGLGLLGISAPEEM